MHLHLTMNALPEGRYCLLSVKTIFVYIVLYDTHSGSVRYPLLSDGSIILSTCDEAKRFPVPEVVSHHVCFDEYRMVSYCT